MLKEFKIFPLYVYIIVYNIIVEIKFIVSILNYKINKSWLWGQSSNCNKIPNVKNLKNFLIKIRN